MHLDPSSSKVSIPRKKVLYNLSLIREVAQFLIDPSIDGPTMGNIASVATIKEGSEGVGIGERPSTALKWALSWVSSALHSSLIGIAPMQTMTIHQGMISSTPCRPISS